MLSLPDDLRNELKEPLGSIYTDADELLAAAALGHGGGPLVAVGDVVTYHLLAAGHAPAVALVDEKTERAAVDDEVAEALAEARAHTFTRVVEVDNSAATLSEELLRALADAIDRAPETTMIAVDGEEDLAALPAVLAIPETGGVVYGQPGEGMVLVDPDDASRERARELLGAMEGDTERALELLSV